MAIHTCSGCRNVLLHKGKFTAAEVKQFVQQNCALFKFLLTVQRSRVHYTQPLNVIPPDLTIDFGIDLAIDDTKLHKSDLLAVPVRCVTASLSSKSKPERNLVEPFIVLASEGSHAVERVTSRPYVADRRQGRALWKSWINECNTKHTNCRPNIGVMPSRLLHITSKAAHSPSIRLHRVQPRENLKYAALSYSWGGDQLFKTTTARVAKYEAGIDMNSLKNYQSITQAIEVAASIGLDYLWIDALCIVQDSNEDKMRELGKMGAIYAGASLTIRSAMTTRSPEGFLTPQFDKELVCETLIPLRGGKTGPAILSFAPANFNEPIDTRGWCFQEQVLSPRSLSFGARFVWWSCQAGVHMDGGPDSFKRGHVAGGELVRNNCHALSSRDEALETWASLVKQYQARNLTVTTDKLAGIAAIAERIGKGVKADYLAGLWAYNLPKQLLWCVLPVFYGKNEPRSAQYRSPTWSWAAVDDKTVQFMKPSAKFNSRIEIGPCSTTPLSSSAPFASITSASLTVKARIKKGKINRAQSNLAKIKRVPQEKGDTHEYDIDGTMDTLENYKLWVVGNEIELMEVGEEGGHILGLIVARRKNDTYQRVGRFDCYVGADCHKGKPSDDFFAGCDRRRLVLV